MSLTEAYRLAHTAECRLNLAASRPDRSLRFVVGHLMTYESLRLRIVEIEHETSRSQRAKAVQFQGAGALRSSSSARRSPPPSTIPGLNEDDEDELSDDDDMDDDEDDEDNGLSLQRFPSGSARPPPLEADLEDDVDEDDEPVSPEEPDAATLETALKGDGSELLAGMYEGVRKCPCHGHKDAPSFGRMWELPPGEKGKEGVTRVIAEEMDGPPAPQVACTGLT
ncbi:hypothetical protein LTR95_000522 [Oleoguttula sp. CCFEE 5521]